MYLRIGNGTMELERIEEIFVNEIGITVDAHIDPNTIGLFYMKQ